MSDELPAGTIVAGKYRVDKLLGAGGMGAVYAAENVALGKTVAIKMLHPKLAAQADVVARFRREARAVAGLDHPGFPQVHALETTPDGALVIEMEFLEGMPVDKLVGAPVARVIAVMESALDALAVAHDAGLVHRDLKPANLFVVGDQAKILDFGIAHASDEPQLTASGQVFGTVTYASPEQLKDTSRADARADVYSMGATAFELLAGQPAAGRGGMTEVMARILSGDIERHPAKLRPEVPAWLDAWVARSLDADPSKRFASARDMLAALRAGPSQAIGTEPTVVPVAVAAPTVEPNRRGLPIKRGLLVLVILAGAIAIAATRGSKSDEPAPPKIPDVPRTPPLASVVPTPVDAGIDATIVETGPPITVDLTVWKGDVALAPGATLHTGDKIAFQVATSHPAYVYVVQRIHDELDVLFPSKAVPTGNPIRGSVRIPKAGAFTLVDDGVYGTVRVNVIASPVRLADLEAALATTDGQRGDVHTAVVGVAHQVDSLGDATAPAGSRGHLELLDDTTRRTVSVRYTQRPGDRVVIAAFDFEQAH